MSGSTSASSAAQRQDRQPDHEQQALALANDAEVLAEPRHLVGGQGSGGRLLLHCSVSLYSGRFGSYTKPIRKPFALRSDNSSSYSCHR